MKKTYITIHEYENIYPKSSKKEDVTILEDKSFNYLQEYILENNLKENFLTIHKDNKNHYVKANKFVGTIQLKDGTIIDILPKIYKMSGKNHEDINKNKKLLLKMIKENSENNIPLNYANINTEKNFPIMEIYYQIFLNHLERLLISGIKKDYEHVEKNNNFLKGKLLVLKNLRHNLLNKSKFYIKTNEYNYNIPQNRLIVSTLHKIKNCSTNYNNINLANMFISQLITIPPSSNINMDKNKSINTNRLYSDYKTIIEMCNNILNKEGYIPFSGEKFNQSLLFDAEKLFESFVAKQFVKYADGYSKHTQHNKYYLVEEHIGKGKFQLIPDIVLESVDKLIILDTKWKNIDSKSSKNYNISIADMYQLFAYGMKYQYNLKKENNKTVKLGLIYPANDKFKETLEPFIYNSEDNLKLFVIPFDLSESQNSYKEQINNIIKFF